MTSSFNERRIADATITKVCMEGTKVQVHVLNWREEEEVLVFDDAIGLEGYGIANASLSHGTETTDDPLLARSCIACEEDPKDFRCFNFFSAWADTPILRVVARPFESVVP